MPHQKADKYTLKFRVVEVKPSKKPQLGFGPKLTAGHRYLLFDEDRKNGLVGQGCVVEGQVSCKHNSKAVEANATAQEKPCGSVCEQDVHHPQLSYVRGVLGATGAALASTKGQQKAAAMIGVGAGTMTEWLLTAYSEMTVDAVDVEGEVMKAAFDCFGLARAPGSKTRLNAKVEDGIEFLRSQPQEHYDIILLDVTPVPLHFAKSVGLIHERLAPGGVLALNGWTYDKRWKSFVQDLAHHFPSVWITRVGQGNELVFTAKSNTANGGSPFPEKFPADLTGVEKESAQWFREHHWNQVKANTE
jgi:predicted O-methyltransferase YrrM